MRKHGCGARSRAGLRESEFRAIQQEDRMPRSKFVTGAYVASLIWLIIGGFWLFIRNSDEARYANAVARNSCRGQEDFSACLDAYYVANGGAPAIDWGVFALQLVAGLAVIWVVALVLKMILGGRGSAE
jgi:hypothetical protein